MTLSPSEKEQRHSRLMRELDEIKECSFRATLRRDFRKVARLTMQVDRVKRSLRENEGTVSDEGSLTRN